MGLVVVAVVHAQQLNGESKKTQHDFVFFTRCHTVLSFVWLGMVLGN